MRLDDEARPLVGMRPAIIRPDGSSRSVVVPTLGINWHQEAGGFSLEAHVAFCPNAGRWYNSRVYSPAELNGVLEAFVADPEAMMEKELGWKWESGVVRQVAEFGYQSTSKVASVPPTASGKTAEEMDL